jgi:hypothetical protein
VLDMHRSGELKKLLSDAGATGLTSSAGRSPTN